MSTHVVDTDTLRRAALMWAFVVQRQAEKLNEAAREFQTAALDQWFFDAAAADSLSEGRKSRLEGELGAGMNWAVTWAAGAEQYFFLAAAAQLRKVVRKLQSDRLPQPPDERMVLLLRNFTEHWEDPTGWSATELRATAPDAEPGRMSSTKHDVFIEGVSVHSIVEWSRNVERVVRANAAKRGTVLPDPPPG